MIVTYCSRCKEQFTALYTNIYGDPSLSNKCTRCGKWFKDAPKVPKEISRIYQPARTDKYWEDLRALYEISFLPDMDYEVFDKAFKGFLSWHKYAPVLRGHSPSTGVTVHHIYHSGPGASCYVAPVKNRNRDISFCLMSDEFAPDVLYVATSLRNAIRIRYEVTEIEGIPPAVLYIRGIMMNKQVVHNISRLVNPKKTILIASLSLLEPWLNVGNSVDILYTGKLPDDAVYQSIRVLEDSIEHEKHTHKDINTGKLTMDNEGLSAALTSLSVPHSLRPASYGRQGMPELYKPEELSARIKYAYRPSKVYKGNAKRIAIN